MHLLSNLMALASSFQILAFGQTNATPAIPQYVYDYGKYQPKFHGTVLTRPAPLVWLHSQDPYRPSDLQAQLDHTTPDLNWTVIPSAPAPLTLDNLDHLNSMGNTSVFLTSLEGIGAEPQPAWFRGITPDQEGRTGHGTGCAIVVVDHGGGTVDAFYFYFYA